MLESDINPFLPLPPPFPLRHNATTPGPGSRPLDGLHAAKDFGPGGGARDLQEAIPARAGRHSVASVGVPRPAHLLCTLFRVSKLC